MTDITLDDIINNIIDMRDYYSNLYYKLLSLGIDNSNFKGTADGLELARNIILGATDND